MKKGGLYTSLFCAITPPLFPYFMPFWYPILLVYVIFLQQAHVIKNYCMTTSQSLREYNIIQRLEYYEEQLMQPNVWVRHCSMMLSQRWLPYNSSGSIQVRSVLAYAYGNSYEVHGVCF